MVPSGVSELSSRRIPWRSTVAWKCGTSVASTCLRVITTWMVARKVLENWLYWLVVDGVLVYLMIASHLVATAVLFAVYLGIVVAGYFTWRRELVTARPA